MSYPYNRRPSRPQPGRSGHPLPTGAGPTLADYERLAQAFEELKARYQQQEAELDQARKELQQVQTDLEIKNEALHRQSEDFKKTEAELVFIRAAWEDANQKLAAGGDQEWQDKFLRLQAEVDNLRKRWEQRAATEGAEFRRRVLTDMLPLADHLDLALQHQPESHSATVKNFIANIEATRRAFLETLRRYGVERVEPQGALFDPNHQEAVGFAPSDTVPADHVAQVLQAGYVEGERVLRPARVLVSSGKQAE